MESPVGLPGRAIRNPFLDRLRAGEDMSADGCRRACLKHCSHSFCIIDRLEQARDGDVAEGLVFSGANVYRIEDVQPVAQVIERLVAEAESVYAGREG